MFTGKMADDDARKRKFMENLPKGGPSRKFWLKEWEARMATEANGELSDEAKAREATAFHARWTTYESKNAEMLANKLGIGERYAKEMNTMT